MRTPCFRPSWSRRIFEAQRKTEEAGTLFETVEASRKRRKTMRRNFLKLYQVDIDDLEQFDLVLDTGPLTPEGVFEKLTRSMDEFLQR